jgi:hypothetical protein
LVLYELANLHNDKTGQCNPSADFLAVKTGMLVPQVRSQIRQLLDAGLIRAGPMGFEFPGLNDEGQPVPANWRPQEKTMAALCAAFPNHHFNPDEAIRDFLNYAKDRAIRLPPGQIDGAFFRSISALLARRRPGQVAFGREEGGGASVSVRSLLSKPLHR